MQTQKKNTDEYMLEYITYLKSSTISFSYWFRWFFDIVSEANVTSDHVFKSQPPSFKVEYIQRKRASTLLAQWALVWRGVLKYITYPEALTISLSFWLRWFLDSIY